MEQSERLEYLIGRLLGERPQYREVGLPEGTAERKRLFRSLVNLRPPWPADEEFLRIQDDYLTEETKRKGLTELSDLTPMEKGIYLWKGDITTLRADAIVNAANSQLLGCFVPCHGCIDNAIHTSAGIQLRLACARIMERQLGDEPTGTAKITSAYNLPCKYVLHTVGPIIRGIPTEEQEGQLADCYRSCLELAEENGVSSIAFCCISTGEFHFPNERAAEIAVRTVSHFKERRQSEMKVIFNVFKGEDYEIYARILGAD